MRMTSGSSGISGEVQTILMSLNFSGKRSFTFSRFSLLLVATSTCLLATASALVSWLALRVTLKIDLASSLFCAKT
ncbi:hypothetical protein D9M68_849680 [compost metagenome]